MSDNSRSTSPLTSATSDEENDQGDEQKPSSQINVPPPPSPSTKILALNEDGTEIASAKQKNF